MDRRELLDKAARDAEERMLLSRVWDKWEQCRLRNVPAATDFLSPQEQASAQRLLHMLGVQDGYVFFGGYGGAERQRLFFLPDWAEEPEPDAVMAVAASWYGGDSLTHRDILGSLMGLGLTRGTIGDILMTDGGCQVLAQPKTAAFLLTDWESAGRVKLKTSPLLLEELTPPAQQCREDTVSRTSLHCWRSAERCGTPCPPCGWTTCWRRDSPSAAARRRRPWKRARCR